MASPLQSCKKMGNEWTTDLRDGQSQQVFLEEKFSIFLVIIKCCDGNVNRQTCIHEHVLQ